MKLGRFAALRQHFAARDVPAFAGISGGRTSGLMAALCDDKVTLCFQNTGREHPRTYDFLRDLAEGLGREIMWLEFRPPAEHGAAPRFFRHAVVNYDTASRDGAPFRLMLQCLADYRAKEKALGPIAPWPRSRICTAYLKHRTLASWLREQGISERDELVGLRADEPARVSRLKARSTHTLAYRTPLQEAGLTVKDVREFWSAQSFDLRLEPRQGNCTACFLKDQSDLARVLQESETDAAWWEALEPDFPNFGGESFPGYAQLRQEAPMRLEIEASLRAGKDAATADVVLAQKPHDMGQRRFLNVVKQEERRLKGETAAWSCACEGSMNLAEGAE